MRGRASFWSVGRAVLWADIGVGGRSGWAGGSHAPYWNVDRPPPAAASPLFSPSSHRAPDLGPAMAGNQIEVLWHLGPEKVWWECAVSCPKLKKDRKERYIYQLE